jgi:hypothetical protein
VSIKIWSILEEICLKLEFLKWKKSKEARGCKTCNELTDLELT